MLKDDDKYVRVTCSWCIERVAEYFPEVLANEKNCSMIVECVLGHLKSSNKIVTHLCNSLHFFSTYIKPHPEQVSSNILNNNISLLDLISKYMDVLLKNLLQTAFDPKAYNPDENVALSSFFAICSLMENAANDTRVILHQFFPSLYEALKSTTFSQNFKSKEIQYCYQSYIASAIESAICSERIQLTRDQTKAIIDLIIQTFQIREGVYEEGILAISAIALCNNFLFTYKALGENFAEYMDQFGVYLIYTLKNVQEIAVCRIAIHGTSDLVRSLKEKFIPFVDQILPLILDIIRVMFKF